MANDDHIAQLKNGVAAWNAWRNENQNIRPNLSDADLIGIPARLTVSKRSLEQGKVEFKLRQAAKAELLSVEEAQARIREGLKPNTS